MIPKDSGFFFVLSRAHVNLDFCAMNTITLDEVLKIFNSGEIFSIRFVKFDAKRKTGGQIREFRHVVGSIHTTKKEQTSGAIQKKKQNHFDNMTRNVHLVLDGYPVEAVKSIHLNLILAINDKKMIL